MTHFYSEMHPGDALYIAARQYPGGIDALAVRMGISASTLYKKLSAKVETHFISFEESQAILWFLREAGKKELVDSVLNAFCWQYDRIVIELPVDFATHELISDQFLEITSDHGTLASEIKSAERNRKVRKQDLDLVDSIMKRIIIGLHSLKKSLVAKYAENE